MIQSIQAGSTAIYNQSGNLLGAGKVSVSQTQKAAQAAVQEEDENTTTSIQGDTLTISEAGAKRAAKTFTAESANRPSVAGTSEDTFTDANAQAISSAASEAGITEYTNVQNENSANSAAISSGSGSGSSSSSSSSSLSQYSEAELKEMLEDGEITQAEYNAEVKSRQESETESEDETETGTTSAKETNETEG